MTVVGSVNVLLAAIEAGKIDEPTADEWLSMWIGEIGYYVPYRDIAVTIGTRSSTMPIIDDTSG